MFQLRFFFFFGNFCLFVDALYLIRCHISLCFFKPCFLQVFEHIYNGCFDIFLLCLISRPSGRQVCCLLFFSVYGSHFHFTACHKLLWKLDILDNVATLNLDFFLSLSGAVVILFLLWLGWTLLVKFFPPPNASSDVFPQWAQAGGAHSHSGMTVVLSGPSDFFFWPFW